jgi:hypothetical protein
MHIIPHSLLSYDLLWVLALALSGKEANKGERWWQQGYAHGGNSSVDLASHGHCAGVFIGIWVPSALC